MRFKLRDEKQVCCICGKEFEGYGNNPDPVKLEGKCCDKCNEEVVIPERIKRIFGGKKNE